jgi:hypothetical protein
VAEELGVGQDVSPDPNLQLKLVSLLPVCARRSLTLSFSASMECFIADFQISFVYI